MRRPKHKRDKRRGRVTVKPSGELRSGTMESKREAAKRERREAKREGEDS